MLEQHRRGTAAPHPPAAVRPRAQRALLMAAAGLALLWGAWAAWATWGPAARQLPPTAAAVPASAHRLAAERQAQGSDALLQAFQQGCSAAAAPATAALALQQLQATEADHRHQRSQHSPDAERLRLAVVQRSCAAYHATRLQPAISHPVWLHTQLQILSVKPGSTGFEVQARATTVDGPVAHTRITFARGLHHSCFAPTDATGMVSCTLVDTHPHGSRIDGWAEAHEGPFVATAAGSMAPAAVVLPAFAAKEVPVFASKLFSR